MLTVLGNALEMFYMSTFGCGGNTYKMVSLCSFLFFFFIRISYYFSPRIVV